MLYPFYNGYNIDDTNIGCNSIIVAQCDGTHVYMNPCDLIASCLGSFPGQLTSDCVVDFLNNLSTETVGNFVRINASHCLEAVPLNFSTTDMLLAVDSTDTPKYGEDIFVGCGDITVNKIGPVGDRKIEICYSGPTSFPALDDVPNNIYLACADESTNAFLGKYLMVNDTHDGVKAECHYKPIGTLYLNDDVSITGANVVLFPTGWVDKQKHGLLGSMSRFCGDTGIKTTVATPYAIEGGGSVTAMRCPRSGVYTLSMKGNAKINAGVQAFRVYIVSTDPALNGCVDSKFGGGPNPYTPMVFPYNLNSTNIGDETVSHFNFDGQTTVYVEEGTYFSLAIAIDTAAGTGIEPEVVLFKSGLAGGTYDDPVGFMGARSGFSLQMVFKRDLPFDINEV